MEKILKVPPDSEGLRLDRFLAQNIPGVSRSFVATLIRGGSVLVEGKPVQADRKLQPGEEVRLQEAARAWSSGDDPLKGRIIHEDASILVLDKPSGLLMHPLGVSWLNRPELAAQETVPNLAGLLFAARPELRRIPRLGIVHRLDRGTSGALVVAKTSNAYSVLTEAFERRAVSKIYRAIVRGRPAEKVTRVEAPVGRPSGRRKIAVTPFGRPARTEIKLLERGREASLVEARPQTGRTHQIRAHLAHAGHPVAGDPDFDKASAPRLMLHAYGLAFRHPRTGKAVRFNARTPADFIDFWKKLRGAARRP